MPLPLDSARRLALEAGALIVSAIDQTKRIDHKSAVNLVTDTDHQAEALIMDGALLVRRPGRRNRKLRPRHSPLLGLNRATRRRPSIGSRGLRPL